ncbi:MAG: Rrf2 family transcriptional regulator [Planctomycetes bacterium]|nr:Rrf2 family transcriptional regulator [Planctomycetota bacterium]
MLSRKTKYALKALVVLARRREEGPLPVAAIARADRIPRSFLENILLELKSAGFVASTRGRAGGWALARSPAAIRIGHVVRAVEGPLAPLPCVSRTAYRPCADCRDEEACEVRFLMKRVRDETARILDGTTLEDAVAGRRPARRGARVYH